MARALSVLVLLAATAACAAAQFSQMNSNETGYFFFYASGQVVVVNPGAGRVWSILRSSDATTTPFPNKCPGSPFRGQWVDVAYGPGRRSLVSSVAYEGAPGERAHSFPDGLFSIDVAAGTVPAFTATDAAPGTATFVPTTQKFWVSTSGSGSDSQSLSVLGTVAPMPLEKSITLPAAGPLGSYAKATDVPGGQLLHAYNLGGQAYFTSSIAAGVYSLDFFHKNVAPKSPSTLNSTFVSFAALGCQATGAAVYSRIMHQAFFLCTDKAPASSSSKVLTAARPQAAKGVVQLDARTNTPLRLLPYSGDKIYITPDESFLLILSSAEKTIHMLQFNVTSGTVVAWNPLTMTSGYTPLDIVFAPRYPYYVGYISYLDADRVGILDFGRVLQCGFSCSPGNSESFVQDQQQMGFHNPPGPDSDFQGAGQPGFVRQSTRAIAAGGGFVCQASVFEMAVFCFNPDVGAPIKFGNISWTQHIRYVPATIANYSMQTERLNPLFDCDRPDAEPESYGGAAGGAGELGFQDSQGAPAGLHPSFRVLASLYAATALVALLWGF